MDFWYGSLHRRTLWLCQFQLLWQPTFLDDNLTNRKVDFAQSDAPPEGGWTDDTAQTNTFHDGMLVEKKKID